MTETRTETRGNSEYTIELFPDLDAESPRSFDGKLTMLEVRTSFGSLDLGELEGSAGRALAHFIDNYGGDDIESAFRRWVAITGSDWRLFTGTRHGYSQGDWFDWFALIDTGDLRQIMPDADPAEIVKQEIDTYATWKFGDVIGYVVKDSSGEIVDSCSGFYSEADARANWIEAIDWHYHDLEDQANIKAAGFVGVI